VTPAVFNATQGLTPRDPEEEAVYALLERLNIPFLRADHGPAHTMEDCLAIQKALGAPIPKNLWLCNRQMTEFYLMVMPGDKPFKTKDVTKPLGCSRLSFAPDESMREVLRLRPGAVSPLGLLFDEGRRVRLILDEDLRAWEAAGFHPCRNTSTVRLTMADFLGKVLPALGREPACIHL